MDKTKVLIEFGAQLREARQQKGWSQEKLALEAGVDRTYVSSIERGRRNLSLLNIVKLADVLGISPSLLVETLQGEKIE